MSKLKISNIETVERESVGNEASFAAKVGRFTSLLGMKGFGMSVVEVEPGKKAWPYHLHYGEEEMFVILKGEGTIRYDDEHHPIKPGDVIYTPPGDGTAHQIINTSDAPLQYLAMSTQQLPEVCYYPDSGKYGSYFSRDEGDVDAFMAHERSEEDYFKGE